MQAGERGFYWHGLLDRVFTVELVKVTRTRVEARILDGQCRTSDQVARVRSFTHKQAREQLIGL